MAFGPSLGRDMLGPDLAGINISAPLLHRWVLAAGGGRHLLQDL
jgi:hypothetical protein